MFAKVPYRRQGRSGGSLWRVKPPLPGVLPNEGKLIASSEV